MNRGIYDNPKDGWEQRYEMGVMGEVWVYEWLNEEYLFKAHLRLYIYPQGIFQFLSIFW